MVLLLALFSIEKKSQGAGVNQEASLAVGSGRFVGASLPTGSVGAGATPDVLPTQFGYRFR